MKKLLLIISGLLLMTYSSYAQDQQRDQKRDRIHQVDHIMMQNGNLYQYRNGEPMRLQNQVTLQNGTVCQPDGTCQIQDRTQFRLRNGECIDMNGNRYLNQNRFNRGKVMTQRQMKSSQKRAMRAPSNPQGRRQN